MKLTTVVNRENDLDLISRVQAGDTQSFRLLVHKYLPYVHSVVLGIVQNPSDAEDISQEVFIKVFRSIKKLKKRELFHSWIYRIAYNHAVDHYRKCQKNRFESIEEHHDLGDNGLLQDDYLSDLEQKKILYHHINKLPKMQRTVLLLRLQSNYSFKEIAAYLNRKTGTIKANYFHAMENLRQAFRKEKSHEK